MLHAVPDVRNSSRASCSTSGTTSGPRTSNVLVAVEKRWREAYLTVPTSEKQRIDAAAAAHERKKKAVA